ncbi:hypothetical protein MMC26_007734 [Xylographa opegraphella]|nr:hypothetical protein [Xylographa opegraphella]
MPSSELRSSLASSSMAPSGIAVATSDVGAGGPTTIQIEDSDFEEIENPYVDENESLKDQLLEDPISQQDQAPNCQVNDDPDIPEHKDLESELQAATVQQNQGPNIQDGQGPSAQQVACRRPLSKYLEAYKAAFEELRLIAERNGPIDRQKDLNMSHGLDIINHRKIRSKGHPMLTQLGVVVVSLRMLQKFEETLREQPTEAEVNMLNSFSPSVEIGELKPFAVPASTRTVNHPHMSRGLQIDPSGHADMVYSSTGIPPGVALELPSDAKRVLVDKDYLMRVERENEIYRYHLQDLEMGVTQRLENALMDTFRGTKDKKQRKHKSLGRAIRDVKASASAVKASKDKGIYMLILKQRPKKIIILRLQPKLLEQLTLKWETEQLHNADRMRDAEEGEVQVTPTLTRTEAPEEKALEDLEAELHIDKKMRLRV